MWLPTAVRIAPYLRFRRRAKALIAARSLAITGRIGLATRIKVWCAMLPNGCSDLCCLGPIRSMTPQTKTGMWTCGVVEVK
jgi:hypothetical protein